MSRQVYAISILLGISVTVGCTLPNRQLTGPRTFQQQQFEATQFDPYADVDAGPEIVGSRPREFQRPAAEAIRNRGFRNSQSPF